MTPRPTKRSDPHNLRWSAILRYASWAVVFPIPQDRPVTLRSSPLNQCQDRREGPKPEVFNGLGHVPLETWSAPRHSRSPPAKL